MLTSVQCGTIGFDHIVTKRIAKSLGSQFVCEQFTGTGMGSNFFVHQRLGQRWCVLLVVAQFAETDDVKHHVFLERHAVVQSHLGGKHYGLWVIAIDVQDRRFHHLDDVRTEHA